MNVLLADYDLDVHKLIADLLDIQFRNVTIDRAMNSECVVEKLSDPKNLYNLIILDLEAGDTDSQEILHIIRDRFPQVMKHLMLIVNAPHQHASADEFKNIPSITKPFSIDKFGDMVKKIKAA